MKKITVRNHYHPHYLLKAELARIKKHLQSMSTEQVFLAAGTSAILNNSNVDVPTTRKDAIEAILSHAKTQYKKQWEEKYGWPFDDCYDNEKLREHLKKDLKTSQS